ncbi:MAG: GIY-YIG nuclease family protein [Chloroflexi bacterium]|nr:GIY-YIG nuclease family protein [Chloroflexota bacterium]
MRGLSFVSLVVGTTGRHPWRDRLAGIAAVRVARGAIDATYATALGYAGGRPRRYDEWGGMDDPDAVPTFAVVEPALREFLGAWPLIGPDIRLHLEHLGYELSRLNRPGLANPALDLATLAELALGPAASRDKPSLARLAERFGLPPHRSGDLLGEARLAARVALRLAAALDPGPFPTLEAVLTAADHPQGRPLLDPERWSHLPAEPGVYVLRDDRGQALYVGKASNLRSRVAAYLGHAVAAPRRMDGLAEATADLEVYPTGSELEASLLELRLISELQPRYNVQRRVRPPRLFLRVHPGEARPRLSQSAEVGADGAMYLGPFRSASAAARARRLAAQVFELRLSSRAGASPEYRTRLQSALLFLAGERGAALRGLRVRMRGAARAGDVAEVARLRELLREAQAFSLQEAALSMSPHTDTFLAFDGRQAYLVHAARLVVRLAAPSLESARAALAPALAGLERPAPPRPLDDAAHLVLRWLSTRGPTWRLVRLP